jgi:hypothetical protein
VPIVTGANFGDNYQPQLTSYDFDAPVTEAGDPTSKYFAIREVIGRVSNIVLEVGGWSLNHFSDLVFCQTKCHCQVGSTSSYAWGSGLKSQFRDWVS